MRRAIALLVLVLVLVLVVGCRRAPTPVGATPQVLGGDVQGSPLSSVVQGLQQRPVAPGAPGAGQVLEWDGGAWGPATLPAGGPSVSGSGLPHVTSGAFDTAAQHGTADQLVGANHAGTDTAFFTLSGDGTLASGALALATVNSNTGTFGSASQVAQLTLDGKGRVTAAANVAIGASLTVTAITDGQTLTAAAGADTVFVADNSASGGAMTCQAPASPTTGQRVTVKWFGAQAAPSNGPTFSGNGHQVEQFGSVGKGNVASSTTVSSFGDAATWVYDGTRWVLVA